MEPQDEVIDGNTVPDSNKGETTYTAADLEKKVQSETDKVRTDYSQKLKQLEQKIEKFQKEKMTEDERKQFELGEAKKAIAEKEQLYNSKLLELSSVEWLKESGLPIEFRQYVLGTDEESTKTRIKAFQKLWNDAINKAVEDKFKGNSRSPNPSSEGLTMDQINSMSVDEINQNWPVIQKVLEAQGKK